MSCVIGLLSTLSISSCSKKSAQVSYDDQFADYPVYEGHDLELTRDSLGTHFTLWSPKATSVRLNIYPDGDSLPVISQHVMEKDTGGVWRFSTKDDLVGKFYTFNVQIDSIELRETPGIWAKAVGTNGRRAAVIDFKATDPDGWSDDKGPAVKSINDAVIYEMHHRDFSIHPESGIAHKGKFLALTENGTTNSNGSATGIDHLRELGVTHVHILPSYDYNSVDESRPGDPQYNWGYDPYNYNAPEGSYSTNPSDPAVRISEMKRMIKSLHDAGIGVIMDVVYNHTADNDLSNFSLTAPGYFYRHRDDGTYSDASGCGNETASEREMMRRYMINSAKYWAEEYHIDGFRFDLMAIHDIETMNQLAAALREVNPDIIIYGEGWTAGDSPLPQERRSLKENVARLDGIAVFSDDIRDAIKGHYSNAEDRGFATGKESNKETVKIGIVGATTHPQVDYSSGNNSKFPYAASPSQVINYVSCHDDLMLTDKLVKSMPEATVEERQRADKLAQTIVFTSQGTPFMFAGEEIFRDKKGVHNSYKSPDSINAIDWALKDANSDIYNYYRELIKLRKAHPAFRMTTADDVAKHLIFDDTESPLLISYSLVDNANGDEWNEIKLVFNGSENEEQIELPSGEWLVVARNGKLVAEGFDTIKGGATIVVAPTSALILARK
ncbi:MAG: type I pullulanase [Muribaculaceae bacterium]|nr:type I pullulanase [Muribaculaceae bacterium]